MRWRGLPATALHGPFEQDRTLERERNPSVPDPRPAGVRCRRLYMDGRGQELSVRSGLVERRLVNLMGWSEKTA